MFVNLEQNIFNLIVTVKYLEDLVGSVNEPTEKIQRTNSGDDIFASLRCKNVNKDARNVDFNAVCKLANYNLAYC